MATGQLISRRCRATQLLSLLLLIGCSCCYVFTTVLLRHVVPCGAAEGGGDEPQPAPPSVAAEPEEGNPSLAPPVQAEQELAAESASNPPQSVQPEGKVLTGGEEVETDSATVDLPDEPIRCSLPLHILPYNRLVRAVLGIDSLEYCQKLCVHEKDCEVVEWDVHVGLCLLKAAPEGISSVSDMSNRSTRTEFKGNQIHADSDRPWPLPASQAQESSGARLKNQRLADSTAVAAVGQEGSVASALVEKRSYFSSFSPVSPDARRSKSIFPIPSKPSQSTAKYTNGFVSTAATSLSQSSATVSPSPSPSRDEGAATSNSAGRNGAAAAPPSSQQYKFAPPATPRAGEGETGKSYPIENHAVLHTHNMVAPRTCGVSCWLSNYKCKEVFPPMPAALQGLAAPKNALPISSGGKFSLANKTQKKSAAFQAAFSPSEAVFTPFDCHRLCELNEACGAFSWDRFRSLCHLCPVTAFPFQAVLNKKAFFASARNHLTPDRSYITGPKQSCYVTGQELWVTPVFQTCFHGNKSTESPSVTVLETLPSIPTPDDCQTQCFLKSGCHHFTWEYHTLNCMLKSGPMHNTLVSARSSITGPKSCFKGCLKNDVSYPKEAIIQTIKTASVFDCKVACAAHTSPRCEGVTYHFATHNCDLAATTSVAASAPPASSFVSSSSSSLLTTTQLIPAVSTSSFISKEPAKPEESVQPEAVCSMCVSEPASLCRIALPEVDPARLGRRARIRSSTRRRGRSIKEKQKVAKRTDLS